MFVRDAFSRRSMMINTTRDELVKEIALIDEALKQYSGLIENCKEKANLTSTRYAMLFFATIGAQFSLFQYGTYVAFSWDIIEPITACTSLLDAVAAYFFWIWAGRPWDITAFRGYFFDRKLTKLFKKERVNKQRYDMLVETREALLKKLNA